MLNPKGTTAEANRLTHVCVPHSPFAALLLPCTSEIERREASKARAPCKCGDRPRQLHLNPEVINLKWGQKVYRGRGKGINVTENYLRLSQRFGWSIVLSDYVHFAVDLSVVFLSKITIASLSDANGTVCEVFVCNVGLLPHIVYIFALVS